MLNSANRRKFAVASQCLLAGYCLLLIVATHLPAETPLMPGHGTDKAVHFIAYGALAALFATTWQLTAGHLTARHLAWAWVGIAVWAALDELTQIPVGRDGNVWDWLADMTGVAMGILFFVIARRFLDQRSST